MSVIFQLPIADWSDLQEKVAQILNEAGMDAHTNHHVSTVRGVANIDVFAEDYASTPSSKIIVECKHWKANVPQEKVHALRTIVHDAGANIGYLISSSDFQAGAFEAAKGTNLQLLTWEEFQQIYYLRWFKTMKNKICKLADPVCEYFDYFGPITRGLNGTSERVKRAEHFQKKFEIFFKASPYLNADINGTERNYFSFPMKVIDPRGSVDEQNEILIDSPRDFFDLIAENSQYALETFIKFTKEI